MRILLLSIVVLLLGCVTQQRCLDKFPPKVTIIEHTHDSIVTVHDTVLMPYQEVSFDTVSPCNDTVYYFKEVSKGGLTSTVEIKNGKIKQTCKADSIQAIVNAQKEYITKTIRNTLKPIDIPIRDSWYYFFRAGFWILLIIVLLTIAGLIYVK